MLPLAAEGGQGGGTAFILPPLYEIFWAAVVLLLILLVVGRYARAAYFGLLKVSAQSHLKAMCLNLLKAGNRLSVPVAA